MVRSRQNGELSLITKPGLFVPNIDQDIVEVKKLITLAEYQTMIIADRFGRYHFISGAIHAVPVSQEQFDNKDGALTPANRAIHYAAES